jgi:Flp pilus assembly pilin Flp
MKTLRQLWREKPGQDIAEYVVMLAVILVVVVGTIQLIGKDPGVTSSTVPSSSR